MNLEKMFSAQKILRERIGYNAPDRFDKLVLALLVEIGECANEWRGFKFWSKIQFPKPAQHDWAVTDDGTEQYWEPGMGYTSYPLLEEYVDILHFILELGIDLEFENKEWLDHNVKSHTYDDITGQFIWLFNTTSKIYQAASEDEYDDTYELLMYEYLALGEMLGFGWEQIETAYFAKNQTNHERQNNGY